MKKLEKELKWLYTHTNSTIIYFLPVLGAELAVEGPEGPAQWSHVRTAGLVVDFPSLLLLLFLLSLVVGTVFQLLSTGSEVPPSCCPRNEAKATFNGLPCILNPFLPLIAACAASGFSNVTNANPLGLLKDC